MRAIVVLWCILMWVVPASAREIVGVTVAEKLHGPDGVELILNGAGIRSKVFFKIYIAELYLQHPTAEAEAVLADSGAKRMIMHVLHEKVEREKLVEAWNNGFDTNLTKEQRDQLAPRIEKFNGMFTTVKKGDTIVLDYLPGKGTSVTVAGEPKGVIEGKDFSDAMFSIWLGKKPVSAELKNELLGINGK